MAEPGGRAGQPSSSTSIPPSVGTMNAWPGSGGIPRGQEQQQQPSPDLQRLREQLEGESSGEAWTAVVARGMAAVMSFAALGGGCLPGTAATPSGLPQGYSLGLPASEARGVPGAGEAHAGLQQLLRVAADVGDQVPAPSSPAPGPEPLPPGAGGHGAPLRPTLAQWAMIIEKQMESIALKGLMEKQRTSLETAVDLFEQDTAMAMQLARHNERLRREIGVLTESLLDLRGGRAGAKAAADGPGTPAEGGPGGPDGPAGPPAAAAAHEAAPPAAQQPSPQPAFAPQPMGYGGGAGAAGGSAGGAMAGGGTGDTGGWPLASEGAGSAPGTAPYAQGPVPPTQQGPHLAAPPPGPKGCAPQGSGPLPPGPLPPTASEAMAAAAAPQWWQGVSGVPAAEGRAVGGGGGQPPRAQPQQWWQGHAHGQPELPAPLQQQLLQPPPPLHQQVQLQPGRQWELAGRPIPPGATTLVVRNVPSTFGQDGLLAVWPPDGSWDYLHCPYNLLHRRPLGYCFINFVSHALAAAFQARWHGRLLPGHGRHRPLDVTAAGLQGWRALLGRVRTRKLHNFARVGHLPVLLDGGRRLSIPELVAEAERAAAAGAVGGDDGDGDEDAAGRGRDGEGAGASGAGRPEQAGPEP